MGGLLPGWHGYTAGLRAGWIKCTPGGGSAEGRFRRSSGQLGDLRFLFWRSAGLVGGGRGGVLPACQPGGAALRSERVRRHAGGNDDVRWDDLLPAEWEENAGTAANPAEVTGFSVGLSTPVDDRLQGTLWIDD